MSPSRPIYERSASAEALLPLNAPYLRYPDYPDCCPPLHQRTVSFSRRDGLLNSRMLRFMAQELLEEERQDEKAWWREKGRRLLKTSDAAEGEIQDDKATAGEESPVAVVILAVPQARVAGEATVPEPISLVRKATECAEPSPVMEDARPAHKDLASPPKDFQEPADATEEFLASSDIDHTNTDLIIVFLLVLGGILLAPVIF